ncbi:cold shock CspA family protein [Labrys monachus]|uniref:Cold shock CspA family protein n=2 Tax=Labrys monachus TaxID=217067 RepID=A0ABU0FCG3_9HYPH|nr:cold shock CspA family protein [Labrys monachus]
MFCPVNSVVAGAIDGPVKNYPGKIASCTWPFFGRDFVFGHVKWIRLQAPGRDWEHKMAQSGTVKFFNAQKGYGFITPDDGGRDIFVHVTAVESSGLGTLIEGQKISFDVEPDKKGKGPKAVNLIKA